MAEQEAKKTQTLKKKAVAPKKKTRAKKSETTKALKKDFDKTNYRKVYNALIKKYKKIGHVSYAVLETEFQDHLL
ncbi:hypothetical protein [Fructilactobacillus florum]|uniref:hypothetical protein n=1 Tax=Fructilactobacillus florum TaxID=640331 RepID=UPI000B3321F0